MTLDLRGIFAPVTTPFDASTGSLDSSALRSNIERHLADGLSGVVLAGSTGEAALLDEDERGAMVEVARSALGERTLVVGASAESTRLAIRRAREASERGADALLVMAPHYYSGVMTDAVLRAHFTRVADESPRPVLLYNMPKYAHLTLSPELVGELSTHENIAGMKDSSGDLALLGQYLTSQSSSFTVMTGNGATWCQAMKLGVRGGILAVALFAPELSLEAASSEEAQARLTPLAREIVGTMGVAGVKAALDLRGIAGGDPRPPLAPLDDDGKRRVERMFEEAGLPVEAGSR